MARLISPPVGLPVTSIEPLSGPRAVGGGSTTSIGNFEQTFGSPFALWRFRFSFAPMQGAMFRRYRGWATALNGGANATRWPFFDPDQMCAEEAGLNGDPKQYWSVDTGPLPGGSSATGDFLSAEFTLNGEPVSAADAYAFSRASSASYFDASGVLQNAGVDVLRIDHDPATHEPRGALLEGEATNLLAASDWSGASTSYGTATPDQAAGPDGTDTLALITSTVENGGVVKTVGVPAGDGVTRCASLFFRKGTADEHRLDIGYWGGPTAPYRSASFYLNETTGDTSGPGGVIDCGGGLYRLWVPLVNEAADGHNVCQIVSNVMGTSGSTAYTGDLQIEDGSEPTSYIATTSGPVTRAADNLLLKSAWPGNWTITLDDGSTDAFTGAGDLAIDPAAIDRNAIKAYGATRIGGLGGVTVPWSNGQPWHAYAPFVAVSAAAALDDDIVRLAGTAWGHGLGYGDQIGFLPFHFGMYMVTEVIEPGTYRIWPPLRKALTTDDFATLKPVMAMRLESEEGATAGRGLVSADGLVATLVECLDYDVRDYWTD